MGCCCENKFTRRQWFTLVVIGCVHFSSAICVSIQAPFYPKEAEAKNATSTEYGFVFGVYELVLFVSSPLLGNYIDKIGAKLLLNAGVFTAGTSAIFFGVLDEVNNGTWFIALSFIIRMIEAVGAASAVTSAFAITAATFPENVATTFATLEIFYGLGFIVGPSLGGVLYSVGGYKLPFIVVGCVMLLVGTIIFFFLPSIRRDTPKGSGTLLDVLKVPAVLLDFANIGAVSICIGFYSATLEPHIRGFMLTPMVVGFVFMTHGGTYAATAPFVGQLCDKFMNPKHMILVGGCCVFISALLVGPAPFIPVEPMLPMVVIGLIFLGFAMSTVLVSAFIDAIRSSVASGFPDDISTYGLVSGLWAASFSLGDFIGPSVAGFLVDVVGFRMGSLFILVVEIIVFTCTLIFVRRNSTRRKDYVESP